MKNKITLTEPGTLRKWIKQEDPESTATELKLFGPLNEDDQLFLKQLTGRNGRVTNLDLTQTTGITEINKNSFEDGSVISTIRLPQTVTSLGWGAFSICDRLSSISLSRNIERIANFSFNGCSSLKTLSLADKVQEIGEQAFGACTALEEINISATNKFYMSFDGILFDKKGDRLIKYPAGKRYSNYNVETATEIGDYAFFMSANLVHLTIAEGATTIGRSAFCNSRKLQTITLPSTIKHISENAFDRCDALIDVSILATTPPSLKINEHSNLDTNIYVPFEALESYKNAEGWKEMKNIYGKLM